MSSAVSVLFSYYNLDVIYKDAPQKLIKSTQDLRCTGVSKWMTYYKELGYRVHVVKESAKQ